ncbi:cell division protein FtsI (penicillin-binding protein 3) [Rhodothermus profundi]|uniref:Beta-lactamase n=2 Tax=Rhodothermus profundi TaxID=633813 RepID=A0A1M6RF62_9BACT|nr:cell division protein FtsI (penicillin-binding protein 3) [Rhodothermus profundi]
MLTRMYVVLVLVALWPLAITGRMFWIYLGEGTVLRAEGQRQVRAVVTIPAMRGEILDRAGRALAVNTVRYDLALDPEVEGFAARASAFFERLARLTGKSAAYFRRRVARRQSPRYVVLWRGLTEAQKTTIERWKVPGVILEPHFTRWYPYGSLAAHVLGFVGADGHGLAGLELQYDRYLQGRPGRRVVQRDRRGVLKPMVGGEVVEPVHGQTLVLTLDLIRQTILEEELARGVAEAGARWGTAIAMDPRTGAVLAMANVPTYDPNQPTAAPEEARRNRAITDRLEPGSTFKLVAAIAALEQGVVALDDTIDTGDGWAVFAGRTIRDVHAYGRISFAEVLVHSSNVGIARVATQLTPGILYQYARNLGFGQPTLIDLPGEVSGTLKRPDQWSGTTLTSMSMGYEVDATPLQILAAYCALANGGLLVRPYVVAERRAVTGEVIWRARPDSIRRAFRRETARRLLPVFERVVNEGTGQAARIEGLPVAGKTGTASKVVKGRYQPGAYRASFVGLFPADDPRVALIVVLDEPRRSIYGGQVAAPVFRRIAERWIGTFPKIAERIAPREALPEHVMRPLPSVSGQPLAVAAARLWAEGLEVRTIGPEAEQVFVATQRPAPNALVGPGTTVRLQTVRSDTLPRRMPDLRGLSARQALYWLATYRVAVRVKGHGQVVAQWPRPGTPLPKEVYLQCQ